MPEMMRKGYMKTTAFLKIWRFFAAFVFLSFLLFAAIPQVQAAEIDPDGIVEFGKTINDDLIISGENVRIDGTVNGLLIAFGNTVRINGIVDGEKYYSEWQSHRQPSGRRCHPGPRKNSGHKPKCVLWWL
jgi:hypothetical protein